MLQRGFVADGIYLCFPCLPTVVRPHLTSAIWLRFGMEPNEPWHSHMGGSHSSVIR